MDRFWHNDFRKNALPLYGLILGHNNEVQLCLILRIERSNNERCVQVLFINKIYLGLEINKADRE